MYLHPITKKDATQRLLRYASVSMGVTHKVVDEEVVQKVYNSIVNALYDGGAVTVRTAEQKARYSLKFSDGSHLMMGGSDCTCYSAIMGNVLVVQIDNLYLYYGFVDDHAVQVHKKKMAEFSLTDRL